LDERHFVLFYPVDADAYPLSEHAMGVFQIVIRKDFPELEKGMIALIFVP
jgi:hypothetical protein